METVIGAFPKCLICNQEIVSDAGTPEYCKVCGMGIEEEGQEFCCESCGNKFHSWNSEYKFRRWLQWKKKINHRKIFGKK